MRGGDDGDGEYDEGPEPCGPCARGGGALLFVLGAGLALMGADLMTGGALTRLVTGGLVIAGAAGGSRGYTVDNEEDGPDEPADAGVAGGVGIA